MYLSYKLKIIGFPLEKSHIKKAKYVIDEYIDLY